MLKSLAYISAEKAARGYGVLTPEQFRVLYGLELNKLYQEFAVTTINAVIGTVSCAADKVIQNSPRGRSANDHTSLLSRNKLARRLETARKTMCASWD
jgi:hypothetical protein